MTQTFKEKLEDIIRKVDVHGGYDPFKSIEQLRCPDDYLTPELAVKAIIELCKDERQQCECGRMMSMPQCPICDNDE